MVEAAHLGSGEPEATLHLCALDAVTNVGHPQVLYVFPPQMSQPRFFSGDVVVSLIFEAGDLANGIVKCIMDPRSKNQVLGFYSMAEGSWVHGGISI